jgi:signal transduction histidine kinase
VKIARSPVAQFLLLSLITLAVIAVGSNYLAGRAAEQEALAEARKTNALLAKGVAQPVLSSGLEGPTGVLDRLDRRIRKQLLIGDVTQVNVFNSHGKLLYSSRQPFIPQVYDLGPARRAVLRNGGTDSQPADTGRPENAGLPKDRQLVEIYTRITTRDGQRLLFDGFYGLESIEERRAEIYGSFAWITIGGLVLLVALVTPLMVVLARRLTRGAEERERLLSVAVDASDAERRRIARDLHDSVVQDLAGTAFSVSALARDPSTSSEAQERLDDAGSSLRDSLRALRSLLAEIHPPDLKADGLSAALNDLVAPATNAGVQASVSVTDAAEASDQAVALVWRVAQEAVRNALRHADATTLGVTVRGRAGRLSLEVTDDGIGFDPGAAPDPDSFGLRGLRSLVAEAGGSLDVTSIPSRGTTVLLEVSA